MSIQQAKDQIKSLSAEFTKPFCNTYNRSAAADLKNILTSIHNTETPPQTPPSMFHILRRSVHLSIHRSSRNTN